MRYTLKDYQFTASADIARALRRATRGLQDDAGDRAAVTLSAPTGAGKTVIATDVIEALFDGNERFHADRRATFLWVTDDPALNEQTKRNMSQASSALGPSRLITIDNSFDQETFDEGHVYFLNIQKLARSNPLARTNTEKRNFSLWETIANTIESNRAHFYVVIDEAHRGMKADSDRTTIVSRIITGHNGYPPAPVVWGISATPDRFNEAIDRWGEGRTTKAVDVPVDEVRSSGLLKDKIVLDNPASGQVGGDTTFIRAAVAQALKFEESWGMYALDQNEPPVLPVLVIQVANKPTDAEMGEVLGALFDAWDGLKDMNVVNTFGEHTSLDIAGRTIQYMAPQDIQDDQSVRVVLCKDAISTGWDCPRAEVLVSLRRATDYTYIAQLIGRMVRTPLARRIQTDQTLNDVHCYLPLFNKDQVDAIVKRFAEGKNDEPPVEIITNPVVLEHNVPAVPDKVFELLEGLPTYVVPGRLYRTQVARLHTFGALLAGDNIVEDAISQIRVHLNGVLKTQRERLESDGSFAKALARVRSLKIERTYALLAAEKLDDLPHEILYEIDRDDNNVEDLFKVAKRKLPEGVAQYYWNDVIERQSDQDYDPIEAKAETAVLALHPEVIEAVESAAEQLVRTWFREYQASISKLSDAKKSAYEPVRRETRKAELTDLILGKSKTVRDSDEHWKMHVLADSKGDFPFKPGGWERTVLRAELKDNDLVGWYRNPTGTSGALRIPYRGPEHDRSKYPDFIMFHRTDEGIKPSIVDPHGPFLTGAAEQLRGLAEYAAEYGDRFERIESVAKVGNTMLALDLKSEAVRDVVAKVRDEDVEGVFEKHGGDYTA